MQSTGKVAIGYLFNTHVSGEFSHSLAALLIRDAQHRQLATDGIGGVMTLSSGPRIAENRSSLVDWFGTWAKERDVEWLFTIDSDMTFEPDVLDRMMDAIEDAGGHEKVPILGGLCFAGGRSCRPYPTVYEEDHHPENGFLGIRPVHSYPRDSLVRVGATGAAAMLVHRSVFARMKAPHPDGFGTLVNGAENPYPWYQEGVVGPNGEPWGEDTVFCRKARHLGIPIHVHTGIRFGHMKTYELTEAQYDIERRLWAIYDRYGSWEKVGDVLGDWLDDGDRPDTSRPKVPGPATTKAAFTLPPPAAGNPIEVSPSDEDRRAAARERVRAMMNP